MTAPKPQHNTINYIELPMKDVDATKAFYSSVFGWDFIDYGRSYIAITGAGLDGGFDLDGYPPATGAGALVILFSSDLPATLSAVEAAGGKILKPTFDFPGGKRFHFEDPNGNELAVWAE